MHIPASFLNKKASCLEHSRRYILVHIWLCVQVRQSAGLLLKNNLKAQYAATTEEFRKYIKVGPWVTPGSPVTHTDDAHTVESSLLILLLSPGLLLSEHYCMMQILLLQHTSHYAEVDLACHQYLSKLPACWQISRTYGGG